MTHVIPLALALLATTPIDEEQDWPRTFTTEGGTASVYTPQLEALKGDQLTARAAMSWEPTGKEPVFGVAFFTATIDVDRDARQVFVRSVKVTKLRFPGLKPENEAAASEKLGKEMTTWNLDFSLDTMLASLEVAEKERSTPGIKSSPPKILVATEPTVLVIIDGEPKLTKVEGTSIERVLNTQFLILKDSADPRYFITSGAAWFASPDLLKGPWAPVDAPTTAILEWFSKNPPPPPPEDEPPATAPAFIVSTEPAELLQFDGKVAWSPVSGVGVLSATNTDSDVFLELASQKVYVLLAGRWFTAKTIDGPWTAVPNDKLPKDFANIPPESDAGHVLAFVAGTPQAKDAVADTQVPTTAKVKRDAGKDLIVTWDGEPKFKPIEGTKLSYGVNTTFSVLLVDGKYWVCHQAVWYVGASPKGPWTVSDARPPGLDGVPASAPVYNVKYVYVYESTPDYVVVGYLPGYVGVYPYHGCVVYGTGYVYPAYVTPHVYYPPPVTWGVHIGWNPWTGWGVGVSFGSPYVRVGFYFGGHHGYYGPIGYRPIPPPYYRPGYPPPGHRPVPGYPPGHRPSTPPPGGRPPGSAGTQPAPGGRPGGGAPSQLPSGPGARPGGGTGPSQLPAGPGGDRPGGAGPSQLPAGPGGQRPGGAGPSQLPAGPGGGAGPSQLPAGPGGGGRPGGAGPSQQPSNLYNRPDNANRNAPRPSTQPTQPSSMGGRPNDVYGGRNGEVYRGGGSQGWEQRQGSNWQQSGNRGGSQAPSNLNRDYSARQRSGGYSGGGSRGGGGGRRR